MRVNRVTLLAYAHLLANQRDARARATRPSLALEHSARFRAARYSVMKLHEKILRPRASLHRGRENARLVSPESLERGLKLCSRSD